MGEGLDSLVFITIAFLGTIPVDGMFSAIITQWIMKTAYEIVATPLTYLVVNFLKKQEKMDTFDRDTDFNPIKVNE